VEGGISMKYIEIPLTKCKVVLTEAEAYELLKSNPAILEAGIKRGKTFKRCERIQQWERKRQTEEKSLSKIDNDFKKHNTQKQIAQEMRP